VTSEWEERLRRWQAEVELFARLDETPWVPLARAEAESGVSRSALRTWYRNGEIPSRLVDGPNGPQRLVPLDAVLERAAQSPRIQRRAEREISLEAQVALLRHRVDQLELRLAAMERRTAPRPDPHRPDPVAGEG
jgi:transposase